MTDTPQHIYELQLKLWLSKAPMERLHQSMINNDAIFKSWREVKPTALNSPKN